MHSDTPNIAALREVCDAYNAKLLSTAPMTSAASAKTASAISACRTWSTPQT